MNDNVDFTEEELLIIDEFYEQVTTRSEEYHKLMAYLEEKIESNEEV